MYAEVKRDVDHNHILKIVDWYCPLPREIAGKGILLIKPNGSWWEVTWRGNHFLIYSQAIIFYDLREK